MILVIAHFFANTPFFAPSTPPHAIPTTINFKKRKGGGSPPTLPPRNTSNHPIALKKMGNRGNNNPTPLDNKTNENVENLLKLT